MLPRIISSSSSAAAATAALKCCCTGSSSVRFSMMKPTIAARSFYNGVPIRQQQQKQPQQQQQHNYSQKDVLEYINYKRKQRDSFRNRTAINYSIALGLGFLTLGYAAVPLYRALCSRTGFGGTPITDQRKFTADKLKPVDTDKRIRIAFTSETSAVLPWKFVPQQREVYLVPGETALAFYKARNTSDKDIVGMATYSVTPGEAAPYFNKIQCFCFEEQKLLAGEEVDMPVFFFIDPDFAKDPSMRNIDDIILHYTFFKAHFDPKQEALKVQNVVETGGEGKLAAASSS